MASFQSDSGFSQLSSSPEETGQKGFRARRGSISGIYSGQEAQEDNKQIEPNKNIKKLKWKINSNPNKIDDLDGMEILAEPATSPPLRSMQLVFPQSLHLTVRNLKKGCTVKDVLETIHKKFKKKADDELMENVLAGLDWYVGTEKKPRTDAWDVLNVQLTK